MRIFHDGRKVKLAIIHNLTAAILSMVRYKDHERLWVCCIGTMKIMNVKEKGSDIDMISKVEDIPSI